MIKNIKIFSKDWFREWQWLIQFAVNSPIKGLREEVRSRLGVICDRQIPIARLLPNSFAIRTGEKEFTEIFYSNNIFADSMYREFLWLWNAIHKWDMKFANHYAPKMNLGFDSLPFYPQAGGGGGNVSVDGFVYYFNTGTNPSFSTIRGYSAGSLANATATYDRFASLKCQLTSTDVYQWLYRGFATFDTSALSSATISAGEVQLYGDKVSTFAVQTTPLHVAGAALTNANNLEVADYSKILTTTMGNIAYASWTNGTYNTITGNSDFLANINKTGVTQFSFQTGWDISNTPPTWEDNKVLTYSVYYADNGSNEPKLVVTYTIDFIPKITMVM